MKSTYLNVYTKLTMFFVVLSASPLFSQIIPAPATVVDYSLWYADQNQNNTLGNYRSVNLLTLQSTFNTDDVLDLKKENTIFLVLELNEEASGKAFLKLGDMVVCDDHVSVSGRRIPVEFKQGEPTILSIQHRKNTPYGQISTEDLKIGDTTLFSLAELIVYPQPLARKEIRRVSTYLALKYSIPITENTDEKWRDYWGHDEHLHWNKKVDFLFDQQVVALGRSDKQAFFQTQTVTNSEDTLVLSLGDTLGIGEMPNTHIEDKSYVIFSKKTDKIAHRSICSGETTSSHPLINWKFYLNDWKKQKQPLFIKVAATDSLPSDSLFVYDGLEQHYLPLIGINRKFWTYRINLENLEDETHYVFMSKPQIMCDEFKYDSLYNEYITELESFSNIDSLKGIYALNEEQYFTVLSDSLGKPVAFVLHKKEAWNSENQNASLEQPQVRVYPNPSDFSKPITIEIENLSGTQPVQIGIFNIDGQQVRKRKLKHQEHVVTNFSLQTPGFYTIYIVSGKDAFVFKHVVGK